MNQVSESYKETKKSNINDELKLSKMLIIF